MQVGDLVRSKAGSYKFIVGIVTCIDPEEIRETEDVKVAWSNGNVQNHSTYYLELISESR